MSEDIIIEEVNSFDVKEDYKLKILLIGDSGVGKTNLIERFISNTFTSNTKSTVGVEFVSKSYKINNQVFKIEFWDTAAQERYRSITPVYYKGAKRAILVFDITQRTSFENIDKWMVEIKENSSKDMKLMIVGNKKDLKDERQVKTEEALDKSKDLEEHIK